jgi:hypothetical protein
MSALRGRSLLRWPIKATISPCLSVPRSLTQLHRFSTILTHKETSNDHHVLAFRAITQSRSFSNTPARPSESATDPADLKRTPLYNLHLSHNGKMVEFGGYSMPLQYDDLSVLESHKWTREKASLFDVSHVSKASICPYV